MNEIIAKPIDRKAQGHDSLVGQTLVYGIANILTKILSICSFPLLARHFSTTNFGIVELFGSVAPLIAFAISFGQDSAVARFFHEESCPKKRRQLISESLWYQLSIIVPITISLWFLAPAILTACAIKEGSVSIFRIVILQGPFCLLYNYATVLLRWTGAGRIYVALFVSSAALNALMIFLGTQYGKITVETLFI